MADETGTPEEQVELVEGALWAGALVHSKRGWVPASQIVPGDEVQALGSGVAPDLEWVTVEAVSAGAGDCYIVIAPSGVRVTVSAGREVPTHEDGFVPVVDFAGHGLALQHPDGHLVEELGGFVLACGVMEVCTIDVGGRTISAGDTAGFGVFTA